MPLIAKNSFNFYTSSIFTEITGKKAATLPELLELLKNADESSIFQHTHQAIKELHFTRNVYTNDFAIWAHDALGEDELSENLASIDLREFPSLTELRDNIVKIIENYLSTGIEIRKARKGQEFYLCKLTEIITPTQHVVWTLFDLKEALKRVSTSSIFYHFFESKLRCGRNTNDFSLWLETSLGEKELAKTIEALDPYLFTLDELRNKIIDHIEKEENILKLIELAVDQTRSSVQRTWAKTRIFFSTPFKNNRKKMKDAYNKMLKKGSGEG
ncbi:DUF5752 family protein [Candidatus Margulisiibacteriota bacterium]